jgi:hypothetical protein
MKKILFVLIALMVSQPSRAEWVEMASAPSILAYYDPSKIESYDRKYKTIWMLVDFNTTQKDLIIKKPFRSNVARWVVDCSRKEARVIASFWYSENMGKGEMVESVNSPGQFSLAPPNSFQDRLTKLACKK